MAVFPLIISYSLLVLKVMKPSLGEAVLAQVTVVSAKDSNILTDIKWHRVS